MSWRTSTHFFEQFERFVVRNRPGLESPRRENSRLADGADLLAACESPEREFVAEIVDSEKDGPMEIEDDSDREHISSLSVASNANSLPHINVKYFKKSEPVVD